MLQRQTEPHTKATRRQLRSSKVVVPPIIPSNRNDHNVPDLENIGNYVECASSHDIYINENAAPQEENSSSSSSSTSDELECELIRMFQDEETEEVNFVPKPKTPKVRKNRKDNFRDKLIELFGSPLDDLNPKSPEKVNSGRPSLPVSIELGIVKLLEIDAKRKGEADASRKVEVEETRVGKVVYTKATDVEEPPSACAQIIITLPELNMSSVKKESIQTGETVKTNRQVIDLTGDDDQIMSRTLEFNGIRVDIPNFKSETNEQGNVPSTPPPAPIGRAETVIRNAITEETRQTEAPLKTIEDSGDKLKPVASERLRLMQQAREKLKRKLEDHCLQTTEALRKQGGQAIPQKQPRIQQLQTNHREQPGIQQPQTNHLEQRRIQTNHQPQTIHVDQPPRIQQPQTNHLEQRRIQQQPQTNHQSQTVHGDQPRIQQSQTNLEQRRIQQQPQANHQPQTIHGDQPRIQQPRTNHLEKWRTQTNQQQYQTNRKPRIIYREQQSHSLTFRLAPQNSDHRTQPTQFQSQPILPQLLRVHNPEFRQVTNAFVAEKILPHFLRFVKWTALVFKFYEDSIPCFMACEIRDDVIQIRSFMHNTVQYFGKKLIQELSAFNVENFSLHQVLQLMSSKIVESQDNRQMALPKICTYLYTLIEFCEQFCQTHFTKKFFFHVKVSKESLDARKQEESFTSQRLAILRMQIQCYKTIEAWMCQHLINGTSETEQRQRTSLAVSRPTQEISSNLRNVLVQRSVSLPGSVPQVPRTSATAVEPPPVVHRSQSVYENVPSTGNGTVENSAAQEFTTPANSPGAPAAPVSPKQEAPAQIKPESNGEASCDVVDLTWIDDADDDDILEGIECKPFPFKAEAVENGDRETVSPVDSGLGSPRAPSEDGCKCLCGNRATFICACSNAMYCSEVCQRQDWSDHRNLCHKSSLNSK